MNFISVCATIVALLLFSFSIAANADVNRAAVEQEQQMQNDEATATTAPAQPAQPVNEPKIKLVHVLNPGEREYLSPNLIGVQNIAMTFLPLTINFVNVIDAFREIVDGVRYELLVNAIDTKAHDEEIICRLVILEKPWIRTEWGDKYRELVNSNCTSDADNLTDPATDQSKLLVKDKYETNPIFNGGTRNELTDNEMAQLEAQIMPYTMAEGVGGAHKRRIESSAAKSIAIKTTETPTVVGATEETSNDSNVVTTNDEQITATTAESVTGTTVKNNEATATDSVRNNTDADADADDDTAVEVTTKPAELNDNQKQWLDDILSVGAYNFEKTIEANRNQIQNEAGAESGVASLDAADVEQAATQLQRIIRSSNTNNIIGGVSTINLKDAKMQLEKSLNKLAAGEGPNYRIHKIHSATRQVVSGTLTKIDADLITPSNDKEHCKIEIWSQPWRSDGNEVTFKCDNQNAVYVRHSRSVEYAQKKTHKKHNHHSLDKTEHLFHKFQIKYKRHYGNSMEHQMRLRIFRQNLKTIEELNRNEMGSAKYGITEFADLTSTEYKQRTGLWQREQGKPTGGLAAVIPEEVVLPKEFDWRSKNVVTRVKNQGNCGSCWAFSVTGNIEGLYALKHRDLQEFSEQELLDCDTVDSACNGGLPDNAYKAIEDIGGLEYESEYPYQAKKKQCHFNKTMAHAVVRNFVDLPQNETAIQQWLITYGPISIGINANAMQFYRGGVSHPWKPLCSRKNLDHGVLIVGYGVSEYPNFNKTLPYWIIKNSWGPRWGEQGYYRVYRGDNTCGVREMATSAILA